MCQLVPGKRCDDSPNGRARARTLNATNKRLRRNKAKLEVKDITDEARKVLEEKIAKDVALKAETIKNPENTKRSAQTMTKEQAEALKKIDERNKAKAKPKAKAEEPTAPKAEAEKPAVPFAAAVTAPAPAVAAVAATAAKEAVAESKSASRHYDSRGFNKETGIHRASGTEFDPETGLDFNGYDYNEFDANGIHKETGTKYNEDGVDRFGYYANGEKDEDFFIPTFGDADLDFYDIDDEDIDFDADGDYSDLR